MSNKLDDNAYDLPISIDGQSNPQDQPVQARQLDRNQKIAIAVLSVFAVLVLFIWFIQTKKSLYGSKVYNPDATKQAEVCSRGDCSGQDKIDLHLKDTDKDGLSDYDELNVYGTSPYLEDSDSDGYSDKQEVDSQSDPNCPFGQECYLAPTPVKKENKNNSLVNLQNQSKEQEQKNNLENIAGQVNSVENILNGKGDIASLRALLLQSGMDKKVLDQISDEDLMKTYHNTLAK